MNISWFLKIQHISSIWKRIVIWEILIGKPMHGIFSFSLVDLTIHLSLDEWNNQTEDFRWIKLFSQCIGITTPLYWKVFHMKSSRRNKFLCCLRKRPHANQKLYIYARNVWGRMILKHSKNKKVKTSQFHNFWRILIKRLN